jgi:hypothetical protein
VREKLAIAKGVPQGRLNLAQDAVLGGDSRDDKSRRDDWKSPETITEHFHLKIFHD